MADRITRRLEMQTQTTGAAQAERDLAKLGQAAATAGEAGEKGLNKLAVGADKAGAAVEEAGGGIAGALDGIGKRFEATDKASEVLGKITGAFGLVTAAAGLAYGAFELIASTMQAGEPVMDRGVAKWNALRDSIGGAAEALGEYEALADPRVLQRLTELRKVVSGEDLLEWQQASTLQTRVAALRDEANRVLNVVGPGPRYDMEMAKLKAAEQALRDRQEDIAAAIGESKALIEDTRKGVSESFGLDGVAENVEKEVAKTTVRAKAAIKKGREDILGVFSRTQFANAIPLADALGIGADPLGDKAVLAAQEALEQERYRLVAEGVDERIRLRKQEVDAEKAALAAQAEAVGAGAESYAQIGIAAALAGEGIMAAIGAQMHAEGINWAAKALGYTAEGLFFSVFNPAAAGAAFAAAGGAAAASAAFFAGSELLGGGGGGGSSGSGGPVSSGGGGSESLTGGSSMGGGGDVVVNVNYAGQPLATDRQLADVVGRAVSMAVRQQGNPIYGRLN